MLIANISAEQDTQAPVITATNVPGNCDEGTEFVYDVTAEDAVDGNVEVTLVAPEGMFDENDKLLPGTWKISFTASDAMGNKATSAEYTVIVKDITPPVITLGGTTAYEAGVAYSEDLPDGMTVTITDNVDKEITEYLVTLEEGAVADGKLQIGVWTVTVKASDAAGNEGIATAEITVTDTQKPVITLDNEKTVTQYDEGDEPVIVATAQDSYDGEVNVSVVYPEGALQDERLVAGTWTITLTAKDTSGNAAEPVTVNITVADKTPPEIMIGGRTEYGAGTAYTEGLPAGMTVTITDNVDGEVTDYTVELESGAVADGKLVAGEWTVTITASDKAGNEATPVTVIIEVNETSTGTGCSSAINGIAGIASAIVAVVICAVVLVTVFKRKKKA